MNLFARASIGAAAALVLGAFATPALASDYTLNLTGPSTGVVGQPMVFHLSGHDTFDPDHGAVFSYSVGVIPTSVASSCPEDRGDGLQLANAAGEVPAFVSQEPVGGDGSFSQKFGYLPSQPGTRLVCAYTIGLAGYTLAAANMTIDVKAGTTDPAPASSGTSLPAPAPARAAPPTASKPTNTKAPHVRRAGSKVICNPGTWSGALGDYAYGWSFDGNPGRGASGRSFQITSRMRGHRVACTVTASNPAGATTVVSAPITIGTRS